MKFRIVYYALLRQERGLSEESLESPSKTAKELYAELKSVHSLSLTSDQVCVAVNSKVCPWEAPLKDGDTVLLMPPVAGG